MIEDASLLAASGIALAAGLASFLSPCVLPLAPVYLASLVGPEIFDDRTKRRRLPVFLHSLSFVIGFSVIFTILGAVAGLAGFAISPHSVVIRLIAGSLLVVFGLFMLAALKVPWLNYEKRLSPSLGKNGGYLRSFLTGSIFCFAWTPCVGPILGSILSLAGSSGTVWRGTYLLAVYSLGLGIPFLVMGAAFDFITPLLRNINRYSNWIYIISGLLLIAVGILILTNKLMVLSAF